MAKWKITLQDSSTILIDSDTWVEEDNFINFKNRTEIELKSQAIFAKSCLVSVVKQ